MLCWLYQCVIQAIKHLLGKLLFAIKLFSSGSSSPYCFCPHVRCSFREGEGANSEEGKLKVLEKLKYLNTKMSWISLQSLLSSKHSKFLLAHYKKLLGYDSLSPCCFWGMKSRFTRHLYGVRFFHAKCFTWCILLQNNSVLFSNTTPVTFYVTFKCHFNSRQFLFEIMPVTEV